MTKWFFWLRENLLLVGALALITVFFFLTVLSYVLGINSGFAKPGTHSIKIAQGMTTWDVSQKLYELGVVRHPAAFRFEARLKGLSSKLQAGLYKVEGGMHNVAIIDCLSKGNVQLVSLTIPEGYGVKDIAKMIEKQGLGSGAVFKKLAKDYAPYEYMQTRQEATIYKAEGFLFPTSYTFPASFEEKDLLEMMVRTFHEEMEKTGVLSEVKSRDLHLRNVVNLAAMVEKEAVFTEEMPLIAGVFQKRLDIDMPIQSDTTIQYLFDEQHEIVTWDDLEIDNPFNTYKNYGLPPGPIASPGLKAIQAALHPTQTDYLYFVAERDGHHRFTTNYDDHLRAIRDIENGN